MYIISYLFIYDIYIDNDRLSPLGRSCLRNSLREPHPCLKFSILDRLSITIYTSSVYTLLTACQTYSIICFYVYICIIGSCITRICIMQPDAAMLPTYVTRYIKIVGSKQGKEDENVPEYKIYSFFSDGKARRVANMFLKLYFIE